MDIVEDQMKLDKEEKEKEDGKKWKKTNKVK